MTWKKERGAYWWNAYCISTAWWVNGWWVVSRGNGTHIYTKSGKRPRRYKDLASAQRAAEADARRAG